MNTVIRHIEYLISRKDCVIIPGIGAILAKYERARIDKASGLLLPPERVYTFNKEINHNDGTLAYSIARAESIRYELACKKMESEIESVRHCLHAKGKVRIGRIGSLCYNKENDTIQFEPVAGAQSIGANLLLPAIKLGNKITFVSSPNIIAKPKVAVSPIVNRQANKFKRFSRLAASIVIILGVCFLAYQPVSQANDEAMKASLAPAFNSHETEIPEAAVEKALSIVKSDKYKSYSELDAAHLTSSNPSSDPVAPKYESVSEDTPAHYVIVAAVRNNDEADKFISMHSDESLNAMPYKNLYVVYSAKCADKNEAYNICCKAASKYPGAWICSK